MNLSSSRWLLVLLCSVACAVVACSTASQEHRVDAPQSNPRSREETRPLASASSEARAAPSVSNDVKPPAPPTSTECAPVSPPGERPPWTRPPTPAQKYLSSNPPGALALQAYIVREHVCLRACWLQDADVAFTVRYVIDTDGFARDAVFETANHAPVPQEDCYRRVLATTPMTEPPPFSIAVTLPERLLAPIP